MIGISLINSRKEGYEMGMSTHIEGIKAPDEEYSTMKRINDDCLEIGFEPPKEVSDYFDGDLCPSNLGISVDIGEKEGVREYEDDSNNSKGYEIELCKLPKELKYIRVYNSW